MKTPTFFWTAFLVFHSTLGASIIVTGTAPGLLTDASINIPANPDELPVSLSAFSDYSALWTVLVTGGTGNGLLVFSADVIATTYSQTDISMTSSSSIMSPFVVNTNGYIPQGGVSAYCTLSAPTCTLGFTFGVPQVFTLQARSSSSYYYSGIGALSSTQGFTIRSYVTIDPAYKVYSFDNGYLTDATVSFISVPEPGTGAFMATGLLFLTAMFRVFSQDRRTSVSSPTRLNSRPMLRS